ncbi:MAG: sterol desaturase family protein [Spirochaetia bacterium]|nr:sterol desaturase family protein [Spirochaetia bacterium]
MHLKHIYQKVHLVHHLSTNPSPWAAFAFHPYESILETLILPVIVFILPIHLYAIVIFLIIMTLMNVIGHLGYELYPSGFVTHPIGRWNNTATHHNMHHRLIQCNYGLYFNWWDFWMNTNHPDYIQTFQNIKQRK